jgi:hypothetical protein
LSLKSENGMDHFMNTASVKYRTGLNIRFLPLLILCAILFLSFMPSSAAASLFENRTGGFWRSEAGFAGVEGGLNAGLHRVYRTFSYDFVPDSLDASKSGLKNADDVIHVTPDGVALPKGRKIPDHYVENPHGRPGSYGEMVDGKFQEKLRIDPATPPGKKGPNYSGWFPTL